MALADKDVVNTGSTRGTGSSIAGARAAGKPKPPKRARLRDIDKPLIATYGRRYHANRDFVTARVARNRRRFRRILLALAALLVVAAAVAWWTLTRP